MATQIKVQSQIQSRSSTLEAVWRQLAGVQPAQREPLYQQMLVQSRTIHVTSKGKLHNLEKLPALMWQLAVPTHAGSALAAEAAQVFYSRNEFAVSVKTLSAFMASSVGSYYRPSDLVTRLVVIYGPPNTPGGGNNELQYVLSMPRLRSVRLIFRDYPAKGPGPGGFLWPSAWAVMELQKRVALTLQLKVSGHIESDEEDMVTLAGPLRDITSYLAPPTSTDEWAYESSKRIVAEYKGMSASVDNILKESGWPFVYAGGISELYARVLVRGWAEEQRLAMLELRDVEMT
ncbi:MAG: hypothetical protein M1839_001709 [Geoglossum umbratile]|nr:MAG: hypothetical protein M1839_001709 [Geoglossum umbratile]